MSYGLIITCLLSVHRPTAIVSHFGNTVYASCVPLGTAQLTPRAGAGDKNIQIVPYHYIVDANVQSELPVQCQVKSVIYLLLTVSPTRCGCLEELERDRCSSSGSSAGQYKIRLCPHFFA
ncbi:hypothetical protein GOODEAATRI_027448 [Goodea atripinnis]|uniref:Uncharacterized protein n=1 Tax=Goodea atripinnis TaxID=208336 RepID=A0ABV0N4R5_9TELE